MRGVCDCVGEKIIKIAGNAASLRRKDHDQQRTKNKANQNSRARRVGGGGGGLRKPKEQLYSHI